MKPPGDGWATAGEKTFLRGLGTFYVGGVGRQREETKEQRHQRLLLKYLEAMKNRKKWGFIDVPEIEKFVKILIETPDADRIRNASEGTD